MKPKNPFLYVVLGLILMLLAGFVYAWSILSAPIAADFPNWNTSQLSFTFTLCMSFFCLGGMINGFLLQRIDGKWMLRASALLFLAGFLITSRMNSLALLYFGYGVLGGLASGFSYNTVMATVTRWYPGHQGMISGILLMGFGLSSMIIGGVFSRLTPDTSGAWRFSMLLMGGIMAVVIFFSSFLLKKPEEEKKRPSGVVLTDNDKTRDYSPKQMLLTITFWGFFIWEVLLSSGGLNVISQARILVQTSSKTELSLSTISLLVGMISVFNGIGRVVFGTFFDRAGRKATMLTVSVTAAVALILITFGLNLHSVAVLTIGFILMGISYGGGPVMSAAFANAEFGKKYYAMNFSIISLCLLVASFGSALLTAIYDKAGQRFSVIMPIVIGMMVINIVLAVFLPEKKQRNIGNY